MASVQVVSMFPFAIFFHSLEELFPTYRVATMIFFQNKGDIEKLWTNDTSRQEVSCEHTRGKAGGKCQ